MNRPRRYLIWLGLITLLAAFLRYYRLDVLPPGLSGDEALETILARDALAHRDFLIYFPASFGGTHPVLVYLTLLGRFFTGNHILTIRFVVATLGIISIPIVFAALQAIFSLDPEYAAQSVALALLGALTFAIAFPNILIHRLGLEVMMPAPAAAITFWGLARGFSTGQRRYYLISGLALGGAIYAAYIARLLPVAAGLAMLWGLIISPRAERRPRLIGGMALIAAALVAFAPLGLYFLMHRDVFLVRPAALTESTFGHGLMNAAPTLLSATFRTLASLSAPGFGDVIPRHNLSGHQVFDVFLSLLLWVGAVRLVRAWRTYSSAFLLAWALGMLLPVILTMGQNSPHFTRMQGAMPAFAGFCAFGGMTIFDALQRRSAHLAQGVITLGLLFSLGINTYDYFVRWAAFPYLFDAFQLGDWQAAVLARDRAATDSVYLSPELLTNPSRNIFDLMLTGGPVRAYPGLDCQVYLDRPARPFTYIVDVLLDQQTLDKLAALYPEGHRESFIMSQPPPAWPLYGAFQVPAGAAAVPPPHTTSATFGQTIRLIGYWLEPAHAHPGDTLTLTLYWQAITSPPGDYHAFVHLHVPGEAQPTAQSDAPPCNGKYPTTRWASSEIVTDKHTLTVPPDFGADAVNLAVGMYTWPTLERLPVTGVDSPDDRFHLPDLPIAR